MSQAIHRDGKYWIAPFAPGFDARMVGGHEVRPPADGQTLRTEYATALRSSPDVLGLISWNEFSENSYVEPSVHYRYQSLDVLRQLRGTSVPTPDRPSRAKRFDQPDDGASLLAEPAPAGRVSARARTRRRPARMGAAPHGQERTSAGSLRPSEQQLTYPKQASWPFT